MQQQRRDFLKKIIRWMKNLRYNDLPNTA